MTSAVDVDCCCIVLGDAVVEVVELEMTMKMSACIDRTGFAVARSCRIAAVEIGPDSCWQLANAEMSSDLSCCYCCTVRVVAVVAVVVAGRTRPRRMTRTKRAWATECVERSGYAAAVEIAVGKKAVVVVAVEAVERE